MVTQATWIIAKVVRNAVAGIVVSWLLAFCMTLGDVFAGVAARGQSFSEFYLASMLWQHLFFCLVVFAIHVVLLRQERLLSAPNSSPTFAVCFTLLGPVSCSAFVATSLAVAALGIGLLQLPQSVVVMLHADLYMRPFLSFLFVVAAHWKTRLIVRNQTVRGEARRVAREIQASRTQSGQASGSRPPRRRQKLTVEIFCRDMPFLLSAAVATGYVHLVESLYLGEDWQLIAFAVVSVAVKAVIQELAKLYLLRQRRTPAVRTMAVVVATPTILIDMQLRTMLLCENVGSFSALGSVLLAAVEIAVRLVKAVLVKRQIRQTKSVSQHSERRASGRLRAPRLTWDGRNSVRDLSSAPKLPVVSVKLAALHTAEVVADMYAEYMAMGCSYGVLLLLHGHGRFRVCAFRSSSYDGGDVQTEEAWALLTSVALQLALKLAADLAACVLESRFAGVQFAQFEQDDAFFVAFLVAIAVANMSITCGVALVT